jgi:hypothetical protein
MRRQQDRIHQIFDRWKTNKGIGDKYDLKAAVLDQFVQLLHFGKSEKLGSSFELTFPDPIE